MGPIGTGELIVVAIVALIVLGPEKLPAVARQLGSALGELRRMSDDVRTQVDAAIHHSDPAGEPKPQQNKKHPGTEGFELIDKRVPDPAEDVDDKRVDDKRVDDE